MSKDSTNPSKPREIWVNDYPDGLSQSRWSTKVAADLAARADRIRAVCFREVIE